ncbi:putative AT-hook motif nuclear-localized protein [Helianthus annuus]|uniref:AT-hook motif nuclear-localized protein n=2 Tax=Helianthus annuus TaxID=4232 RepID=A0A9K3EFX1_HELAN|nr:putative AT-hook motif nuclear-localized protein [Helianthus annuus]KAJ0476041.1 putative AT-hook motif nuclear-localized protein [Helianthus annuus]KAJ0496840.1 putative AT-hook motif nuclear-localized protein [Helianthus annuus]KAJ0662869.1 putative AT-hook motif nuclear-localized protein [Helianthus annuus]KAJ0848244.1 putative AT-hook motif nuclear-localized protein [Helianthus annuus]
MNSSAGLAFTPHNTIHVSVGEGRFEMLCLSGCYLLSENSGAQGRTGGLSISVCSADGNVIGGRLVASSSVQVMLCSFVYGGGSDVKAKTKTETSSRDEKRLDIQLNETSPEAVREQQKFTSRLKKLAY